MRIGVDATCWVNPRGYGRFTRHMLTALLQQDSDNEYVFFMDSFTASQSEFPPGVTQIVTEISESPTQAASADGRRGLRDMITMGKRVSREPLDIFFYPSVYTYYPIRNKCKKIVAIHDVIAEQYPELVFRSRKNKVFWDLKTWLAIRQSDLILTVSEFSKRGIADHFRLPEQRIRVVSEGSADSFGPVSDERALQAALAANGLSGTSRYILYVGGIAPHKNLQVLVEAFSELMQDARYDDVRLVMVGDYENDVFLIDEKLKNGMDNPDFRERVVYTGYVSDSDLNNLYNGALVFVLPSFCEGFGLPALEAMSCGTVVIGSSSTSIPEVVGDAGLFFDPHSKSELAMRLREVIDNADLRADLERRALERAATFSWQRSAQETRDVFQELAITA